MPRDPAAVRRSLRIALVEAASDYYLPKWHGSDRALEDWAKTLSALPGVTNGNELYLAVYRHAHFVEYGQDLFQRSAIDWTHFKRGILELLSRAPVPENVALMAMLSCLAGDKTETRRLFETQAEGTFRYPLWTLAQHEVCRSWSARSWLIRLLFGK